MLPMACRCGKRQSSPEDPLILGNPDGTPARLVQALSNLPHLGVYELAWVTGDHVNVLLDASHLRLET